jgi:hypothetical protein
VRKELFWDYARGRVTPEIEIERAVNFGGFEYVDQVRRKYGRKAFISVLMNGKNLSRRAVNYWCLVLGLDRNETAVFKNSSVIWHPFR